MDTPRGDIGSSESSRRRLVALILWIAFIWANSLVPGDVSSAESGFFLQLLRPLIEAVGTDDLELAHTVLRKIAHFSEYAALGVLAWRALGPEAFLHVVAVGIAVPCIDETIQRFIPGRVGALGDVAIDMAGFATAIAICLIVSRHKKTGRS